MFQKMVPRAAQIAQEMLEDPDTPAAVRVRIIELVLDRAYGRAPQAIQIDEESSAISVTFGPGMEKYLV